VSYTCSKLVGCWRRRCVGVWWRRWSPRRPRCGR
jgi:hypothetical protein